MKKIIVAVSVFALALSMFIFTACDSGDPSCKSAAKNVWKLNCSLHEEGFPSATGTPVQTLYASFDVYFTAVEAECMESASPNALAYTTEHTCEEIYAYYLAMME